MAAIDPLAAICEHLIRQALTEPTVAALHQLAAFAKSRKSAPLILTCFADVRAEIDALEKRIRKGRK